MPRPWVIANTATQVPYPVAIGQAKYPSVAQMFQRLAAQVGALLAFDAGALAREAGSPLAVNMVLLGALVATGSLPISAQDILSVIGTAPRKSFWPRIFRPLS